MSSTEYGFYPPSGSGDSSLSIGATINGGSVPGDFLIVDPSGNLGQASLSLNFLPLSGGTLTGPLILNSDATSPLQAVTLEQLQMYVPISGGVTMTGLFNLSGPGLSGNNPVTYTQLQAVVAGATPKGSVTAATTTNITLSGTQTVDGTASVVGNSYLVRAQTSSIQDGIYVASAGAWTLASDFVSGSNAAGAYVAVLSGPTFGGQILIQLNSPCVVGTDPQNWQLFSVSVYSPGLGLSLSGSSFSVVTDNTTIGVNGSNQLFLENTAVVPGSYTSANLTVDSTGRITAASNGGGSSSIATSSLTFDDFISGLVTKIFQLGSPSGAGSFVQTTTQPMSNRPGVAAITSQLIGGRYGIAVTDAIFPGQNVCSYFFETDVYFPSVSSFYPVIGFTSNYTLSSSSVTACFVFNKDTISVNGTTTNTSNQITAVSQHTSTGFTGTITSASPTITAVTSFVGINIGNTISGTGIAAGTYIIGFNSGAQTITMSANATASSASVALTSINQVPAYVHPGASITGTNIPGGTVISSINSSTGAYTLSNNATGSGAQVLTITNPGTWVCITGPNKFNTGITVVASTWYKLGINLNSAGTLATYSINGTQALATSSGVPVGTCNAQMQVVTTLQATANIMYLDYASIYIQMATSR